MMKNICLNGLSNTAPTELLWLRSYRAIMIALLRSYCDNAPTELNLILEKPINQEVCQVAPANAPTKFLRQVSAEPNLLELCQMEQKLSKLNLAEACVCSTTQPTDNQHER